MFLSARGNDAGRSNSGSRKLSTVLERSTRSRRRTRSIRELEQGGEASEHAREEAERARAEVENQKLKELAVRLSVANQKVASLVVLDPSDWRYRVWLSFVCVLSFYSSSEASFTITFAAEHSRYYAMLPLAYLIDIAFMVNVAIFVVLITNCCWYCHCRRCH